MTTQSKNQALLDGLTDQPNTPDGDVLLGEKLEEVSEMTCPSMLSSHAKINYTHNAIKEPDNIKQLGNKNELKSIEKKHKRRSYFESERLQRRQENLEHHRRKQRAKEVTREEERLVERSKSSPRVLPKLIGSILVEHCLYGLNEGFTESAICTRAGYESEEIDLFRRFFSQASEVDVAPLEQMVEELRMIADPRDGQPSRIALSTDCPPRINSLQAWRSDFRSAVLAWHGSKCVCCDIDVPELMEAAHIVPVDENGADSPVNGLPLCSTHRKAFDRLLFAIHPETLDIELAEGMSYKSLQIIEKRLVTEGNKEALRTRWQLFHKWK